LTSTKEKNEEKAKKQKSPGGKTHASLPNHRSNSTGQKRQMAHEREIF
jgi:hypothetical protein